MEKSLIDIVLEDYNERTVVKFKDLDSVEQVLAITFSGLLFIWVFGSFFKYGNDFIIFGLTNVPVMILMFYYEKYKMNSDNKLDKANVMRDILKNKGFDISDDRVIKCLIDALEYKMNSGKESLINTEIRALASKISYIFCLLIENKTKEILKKCSTGEFVMIAMLGFCIIYVIFIVYIAFKDKGRKEYSQYKNLLEVLHELRMENMRIVNDMK